MTSFITSAMNFPPRGQTPFKGPSSTKQKNQLSTLATLVPPTASSRSSIPSRINAIPKKPMRPLTAYHIFFQIEREYIIQTTAGEDADKSIHDNKVHHEDVPIRYKNIKLLPDWYAGPGKRKKRKHRKQHGKIGFLELSRVISTRWAQLQGVDPETKGFVQGVAQQELDEYYLEMKEYKELTKHLFPAANATTAKSRPAATTKRVKKIRMPPMQVQQHQPLNNTIMTPRPEMISSSHQAQAVDSFVDTFIMQLTPVQLQNDIDHFLSCIDNKTQHLLPQNQDNNNMVPLSFGFENQGAVRQQFQQHQVQVQQQQQQQNKRNMYHRQDSALSVSHFNPLMDNVSADVRSNKRQCTSNPNASCMSPTSTAEVDICDDEILQLWRSHN